MIARYLLLVLGVFACATAVIFIKLSHVPAVTLSAWRCLAAAVLLTPLCWRDWRRYRAQAGPRRWLASVVPGLFLGAHFVTWNLGARLTPAANASLIVNLMPIAMPFVLYGLIRERLTRHELAATAPALVGLGILAMADFNLSRQYLVGDLLCLGSMLLMTLYLAVGRQQRERPGLWLYVVPLYYVAGGACLLAAPAAGEHPFQALPPRELGLVLALALIPTITGHTLLNHSIRHLRGQVVSVVNLAQFVFAGALAYPFLGEIPALPFYLASACIVVGGVLATRSSARPPDARPEPR